MLAPKRPLDKGCNGLEWFTDTLKRFKYFGNSTLCRPQISAMHYTDIHARVHRKVVLNASNESAYLIPHCRLEFSHSNLVVSTQSLGFHIFATLRCKHQKQWRISNAQNWFNKHAVKYSIDKTKIPLFPWHLLWRATAAFPAWRGQKHGKLDGPKILSNITIITKFILLCFQHLSLAGTKEVFKSVTTWWSPRLMPSLLQYSWAITMLLAGAISIWTLN